MNFCEWHAPTGWKLGTLCPECGHSDLVHVGTKHCPVCELVWQASRAGRLHLARVEGF